jgi:hypothetical protein
MRKHSDQETAETISAGGLAAVTRTYAKVIADTDGVDLKEMRESIAPRGTAPGGEDQAFEFDRSW